MIPVGTICRFNSLVILLHDTDKSQNAIVLFSKNIFLNIPCLLAMYSGLKVFYIEMRSLIAILLYHDFVSPEAELNHHP